ncbi:PAS domain-containing protein [Burkholderia sp. PAMC 26561]|uniref:PAS domain-containing protein n=1 Tax=Burkholderia sp. PAMC 26561 TaxID=1795043 RepID=UPI00076B64DE|nr:PAS domain-containing protein [Burkholderia sp. PAMC 26561]AME28253.1 hypothetical protein AXG89_30955 [Burkholderia sp. PAMC 26561]
MKSSAIIIGCSSLPARIDPSYAAFWEYLRKGSHASGEYRRFRKDGKAVWPRATYNPILDIEGRPFEIVKYAVDVTLEK